MEDSDDLPLIDRARQGDRRALETLLGQLQPTVYKFGLKMCRNEEDAQEVLQDTLLAAVRHLPSFRGDSSLSTWIYTVARSVCIKHRRRSKFAPAVLAPLDHAAELPGNDERADDTLERAELGRSLTDAIAALEPMYREVLLLRDVEGLSAVEVAEALELSVDAVKSRLHRARTRVREALAPSVAAALPPGPSCPDVVPLLSRHLEGEIGATTCKEMEAHVAGCPRCGALCDSLRRTLRLCQTAGTAPLDPALQQTVRQAVRKFLDARGVATQG